MSGHACSKYVRVRSMSVSVHLWSKVEIGSTFRKSWFAILDMLLISFVTISFHLRPNVGWFFRPNKFGLDFGSTTRRFLIFLAGWNITICNFLIWLGRVAPWSLCLNWCLLDGALDWTYLRIIIWIPAIIMVFIFQEHWSVRQKCIPILTFNFFSTYNDRILGTSVNWSNALEITWS